MEEQKLDETDIWHLIVIDRNNIQLIYNNTNTIELKRNRSGY